jgi:hypothetical protein
MRRGIASLIMGLSLLVASASWAGFVFTHTVLDPDRSERLADHLLDSPDVRSAIVNRMADAMQAEVPAGIAVPRQSLELAATVALNDPRVETLVRDGIVKAHQNALNGIDEPITLDASVLGQAGRAALVGEVPTLDLVLPAAPTLQVDVPATGLAWLGAVKLYVDRFTVLGALVAVVGMVSAFVLARNRPAALRRVAYWAFGSAAFWLAVGFALPAVVGAIAPSAMAIVSAAIDVFAGSMIIPALTLAAAGVALLLVSFLWPAMDRRRPAAMLERAAGDRRDGGRNRAPAARQARTRSGAVAGAPYHPGYSQPPYRPPYDQPGYQQPPLPYQPPYDQPGYQQPQPSPARPEPTREYPVIVSSTEPATATGPGSGAAESWVEGVGYVDPRHRDQLTPELSPEVGRGGGPEPAPDEAPTLSVPRFNDQRRG